MKKEKDENKKEELYKLAYIDKVTKIENSNYFIEKVSKLLKEQFEGYLLIIDVEKFKIFNKKYGRTEGNKLLQAIAKKSRILWERNIEHDDFLQLRLGIGNVGTKIKVSIPEDKFTVDGADKLYTELNMMLDLDGVKHDWRPPIKKVMANRGEGINELLETIEEHQKYLEESGTLAARRHKRAKNELLDRLNASIGAYITEHIIKTGEIDTYVKDIETRQNDPYTVVNTIMDNMLKK